MQYTYVYCIDYVLNNMVFFRKILLDTLMQIFIMLRHMVAEISRFKFDDCRVIRTGSNDPKLFVGGVHRTGHLVASACKSVNALT